MIDLPLLLVQLLVILAGARLAGRAVRLVGQPLVIGEMLAGLALGPSLLGALAPGAMAWLFPPDRMVPLATLSQLGVILFMFVVGLRLDLSVMRGRVGSAVAISHASIVIPFVLGAGLGTWLYPELAGRGVARLPFVLFTGAAMSVTAFPVLARILAERGLVQTRLGAIAIACAAVDDVTAWCLLAGVVAVARAGDAIERFGLTFGGACLFGVLAMTIGRGLLRAWLERRARDGAGEVTADVVGVVSLMRFCVCADDRTARRAPALRRVPRGRHRAAQSGFAEAIADRVESVVGTVLLPVFFVLTGLRTEVGLVSSAGLWGVFCVVLFVAVAGKARRIRGRGPGHGTGLAGSDCRGHPHEHPRADGAGDPERRAEIGVISPALFAMMVLMALATTVATSPMSQLRSPRRNPSSRRHKAMVVCSPGVNRSPARRVPSTERRNPNAESRRPSLKRGTVAGTDEWLTIAQSGNADDIRERILTGYKDGKPFTPYVPTIPLPRGLESVLDFGCGLGRNFPFLATVARTVIGYDLPPMIERCRAVSPVRSS